MKNTLLITFLFLAGINSLSAQSSNRYDWGIEGGPNLSTLRISNRQTNSVVYGSAGFIFQYNTRKILSFKTGFSYQRKGAQMSGGYYFNPLYNQNAYFSQGKSIFSMDYISLPLLVKASFGKKTKFFINAGPYAAFLLSEKTHFTYGDYTSHLSNLSSFKRLDFGVTGGIGLAVPIKEFWMVHIEFRNYLGAQEIHAYSGDRIFTNTTDMRLGVVYRLGFREEKN
ncbi:porin family protein [Fluviicola sp.]|uniref:porin family protein n=1 Tax=Fluviicola sp. TaxID=1917219 RepID=UPI0031D66200